jgi:hypothetical protein
MLVINKGIIVNMNYIRSIENGSCTMKNGRTLPVKIRESARIQQKWNNYLFTTIRREQQLRKDH